MRTVLLLTTALALAACNKPRPTAPSGGAVAVAGGGSRGVLASIGTPQRRGGLWEQTMTRDGEPSPMGVMRMCIDQATDARMSVFGKAAAGNLCQSRSVSRDLAGVFHFSSTCAMGHAGTVTSTGTASGDFSSKYLVHSESQVSGSSIAAMNGHHVTEMQANWAGPCPANMAPGDVIVGGFKMNLNSMAAGAGNAAP
ncbi:MAG TPA: DUF3617 family protein [Caulobacteraceae bacterium]